MQSTIKKALIDPIELTKQLVAIESTTYYEGNCGAFLRDYLRDAGWEVETMPVAQHDPALAEGAVVPPRFNVYAQSKGAKPEVVFSTHFDTVPPYMPLREDAEYLHGRGTCDAKGILATQVAAADRLRAEGIDVGMLYVVGEERDSAGANEANKHPKGAKFLINGEPTENKLALGTKGALRVELRAKGKMAHSAYPELGDSAIEKLVHVMKDLLAMELPVDPVMGPSTLNIGVISGGHAPNVIADGAEALIIIRTVTSSDVVKKLVLDCVAGRVDVKFTLDLAFVRLRKVDVPGLETMVAKYATDIPSLTNWGEPLLLGPGTIHVAHTPDEKILKKDLLECVEHYVAVVKKLVG